MKSILASALILALLITGASLWVAVHTHRMAVSSSQLLIHGTPVCVTQEAGEIRASIGLCGSTAGESPEDGFGNGGGFHGGTPPPFEPRLGLPPGHPPVGIPPATEEGRRILI